MYNLWSPFKKYINPLTWQAKEVWPRVMNFCLLQDTRKLAHYFESADQQDKFKTISQFWVGISKLKQTKSHPSCKSSFSCNLQSNTPIFFVKLINKSKLDLINMAPLQTKIDCRTKLSFCFLHYVTISQRHKFQIIVQKVLFKDFILYAHDNIN